MADAVQTALTSPSRGEARLSHAVSQLTRRWLRLAKGEARTLDLSLPQIFLLGGLREKGHIPVTRWAEQMGASPSATTGLLDTLEARGYVLRVHDEADRRQVLVSLTPKGRRLAEKVRSTFQSHWTQFCAGIPPQELETAAGTLELILQRMDAAAPDCDARVEMVARAR